MRSGTGFIASRVAAAVAGTVQVRARSQAFLAFTPDHGSCLTE